VDDVQARAGAADFSRYADRTPECIGEVPGREEILLVLEHKRDMQVQEIVPCRKKISA